MGHMKKILILVSFLFVFAGVASAHEGLVDLTNDSVSCKGVSVYKDGYYNVSGRCDGLVYPYETTFNKYVLWGKSAGGTTPIRIGEIDRGYFSGNISTAFDEMTITAEQNGLVRKQSDKLVVSGKLTPFDFDKSKVTTSTTTNNNTSTTKEKESTVKAASTTTSTAGAIVGKIVTSLLVVILVIVGLAIGASLLFRSRGSVSA